MLSSRVPDQASPCAGGLGDGLARMPLSQISRLIDIGTVGPFGKGEESIPVPDGGNSDLRDQETANDRASQYHVGFRYRFSRSTAFAWRFARTIRLQHGSLRPAQMGA